MGDFTFQRGILDTITLAVLTLSGTVPSYPIDYTQPQVRISHINGGIEVEDLALTSMMQVVGSNRWYYKYTIPTNAAFTRYLVTFSTIIQTVPTLAYEEFRVIPPIGFPGGTGEFPITIKLEDQITLEPLVNVLIEIFNKLNPSMVIATTTTDPSGYGTIYLNTGEYSVKFIKVGSIPEVHSLSVNSDGTYVLYGD